MCYLLAYMSMTFDLQKKLLIPKYVWLPAKNSHMVKI
jgi:hypothetical protein